MMMKENYAAASIKEVFTYKIKWLSKVVYRFYECKIKWLVKSIYKLYLRYVELYDFEDLF